MAAKKTASVTSVKGSGSSPAPKLNIPDPVRSGPASTTDLLSQLTGNAPVATKKKDARPTLTLTDKVKDKFRHYVLCKVLFDHFESKSKNATDDLKGEIFPLWIDSLWQQKSQPANPALKVELPDGRPDCEGQLIVQERFKVQGDTAEQTIAALVELDFSEDDATRLVNSEIDYTPNTSINFNELQNGRKVDGDFIPATPEEQATANKALRLLLSIPGAEPLTDQEKTLLISRKPNVKVRDGFFMRLASYCRSREHVVAALTVITPVQMAKGAKFGVSDTLQQRSRRLIEGAGVILGVKVSVADELTDASAK